VAGLATSLGAGAATNSLEQMHDIDTIFLFGSNPTEAHPIVSIHLKEALRKGAKLVVGDPRKTWMAKRADVWLNLKPGTNIALINGIIHAILKKGWENKEFINRRTEGFKELRDKVREYDLKRVEKITGVSKDAIVEAARLYSQAKKGMIVYGLGVTEHASGTENAMAIANLALVCGHIGRPSTGIMALRGQNNVQGSSDLGPLPATLPGYQSVTDHKIRAKFEKAWGRAGPLEVGPTKVTALEEAGKTFKAMLINGENTVVSDPDRHLVEEGLKALEHLVVVDIFKTETAELAHVVLPATAWAETDGSFTNTERRVQRVRAAVSPPGEAKPDWWITAVLAKRLGFSGFDWESPQEVFDEFASLMPIYNGLTWKRISEGPGVSWPVPSPDHPGTPRLHESGPISGRGVFKIIEYRDPAEVISEEYPIWLTTGRRLQAYHTRTQTGRAAGIDYLLSEETLEVHPEDVEALGLTDGGYARVTSPRGDIRIRVQASARSPKGTVFTSFAFSGTPVNVLTGGGYDPVTHTAELKVCPVRVEPD